MKYTEVYNLLYKEAAVADTDKRILHTPQPNPHTIWPHLGALAGGVIGGLGALATGGWSSPYLIPAGAAAGTGLITGTIDAVQHATTDEKIRNSVAQQKKTLDAYDNDYKPWQADFYRDKGYVQKPTGQLHPDTGEPVMQWAPPD